MRNVLVTGANKGIGLAIVQAIVAEQPDVEVWLGSRDAARGAAAARGLERVRVLALDVQSDESVAEAARALAGTRLHGIVNNAGIAHGSRRDILDVNVLGLHRVATHLLPLVEDGGRIVNVTSAAGPSWLATRSATEKRLFTNASTTWEELRELVAREGGRDGTDSYGLSKACANLYTLILARENPRLRVNACTPGYIETDLTRPHVGPGKTAADLGMKPPSAGARAPMHLLFGDLDGNGRYYGSDAKRSPLDAYRAPGSAAYEGP